MKKKYILLTTLTLALSVVGCSEAEETTFSNSEKEEFTDEVIATNIESALDGFTLTGTVVQTRYSATDTGETDEWGDEIYEIEYDDVQETNTYYTNVKFDNKEQNKFYKYSYRSVGGIEIAAEGPYTYFEDEEGYAYALEIDYTNKLTQSYATSNYRLLNFAANGFYNFFSLFNDGDFTLDEERSGNVISYYNINSYKANIIANNLLYSLNSGVYSTIEEAYILVRNGVFTQLYIDLTPIQSVNDTTSEVTYIGNVVTFEFSDIGETTIEETVTYDATTQSRALDAVLDTYSDNFTISVTNSYSATDTTSSTTETVSETVDYYLTGNEIYVHEGTSGEVDKDTDFYLAPINNTSNALYPYGYDSTTQSWVAETESTLYDANGNPLYGSNYLGFYTYEDLLPIVSDVSGAVFEYQNGSYDAYYEVIDSILSDNCFIINKAPFRISQYSYASSIKLYLNVDGTFSFYAGYSYTDYNAVYYYGNITATFKNVGTTTLPV